MNWIVWSLVANVSVMSLEFVNRSNYFGTFLKGLPYTIWLIMLAQIGLYYCFRDAPSYMTAWAVFTVGNAIIRVISNSVLLNEQLNWMIGIGVVGMVGCAFLIKSGISS